MLDVALDFARFEITLSAVFGSIFAGVALRSIAGVVSKALARRGARAAEGG
jgi:hypothetical protein